MSYNKPKRLTPWQVRRDAIDPKMRVALCLHIICGYPQTKAYEIAFDFKGKASSIAPLACRFFNSQEVVNCKEIFQRYFYVNGLYGDD